MTEIGTEELDELLEVEKLLEALTRPIFIWRMTHGGGGSDAMRRSASTRRINALREARDVVRRWNEEHKPKPFSCDAYVYHGPGHQSKTKCQIETPHRFEDRHETVYGSYRQFMEWRGENAFTGFFDEPKELEEAM